MLDKFLYFLYHIHMVQFLSQIENNEKNIHTGHRKRLMELANRAGFQNLTEIQAVELILCYVFPRGDVNPLAHRLLDKYKNLPSILEASIEDLQEVRGMGYMSSLKLHNLLGIYEGYVLDKAMKKDIICSQEEILDYIESLLRFKTVEETHVLGVNYEGELLCERCIARGNHDKVKIQMRDIALFVSTYNVPGVILVHNHPHGKSIKSKQDEFSNEKINNIFNFVGCQLVDNLVIGSDGIYSLKRESMCRVFFDNEESYLKALEQLKRN